ncbi:TrkH family potassium uptake protein [Priestia megaterium]|uniref:Uncharacterized protein n=1 Tax=Priestia megaterium TaxID=1404 RepID=A0A6M6E5Y3_PRIMG|nr:potassium transporter TrkG [Priestia megaterium]QJX80956.1 hypothetical protein FDZ14_33235 [Priestia megaterium]
MLQNRATIKSFRYIFLLYISVIVCFSVLYSMPIAHRGHLSYIDTLFVSTSALSVTGLSTLDVAKELTRLGQALLIIEMQLGGIGILVLISYLFLAMGKRISMSSLILISQDQNQSNLKTIKSLSFSVLIIALIIETICFFLIYGDIRQHYDSNKEAIFVAAFHSVASFTNSGFTLFGFETYKTDKLILYTTAAVIFLGSLGFPTIMEILFSFRKKKSLFTKINIRMHFILLAVGTVFVFLLEHNKILSSLNFADKVANSIFLSATLRSGGISTVNISSLAETTVLVMMCLMFIGGASSSTGGGIRLTTFRVLVAKMVSVVKSQEHTVIGKKTITQEAVNKSFLIFLSFTTLVVISTILIIFFDSFSLEKVLFEVESALTNTGLSLGITSGLSSVSKVILICLMVIGRIGIFTLIYFVFKVENSKIKYLREDLAVG